MFGTWMLLADMSSNQVFVVALVSGVITGIVVGLPAIILALGNYRVLIRGLTKVQDVTKKADASVKELKAIAIETKGLVNHQALVGLQTVEGLRRKIAESGDQRDIDEWHKSQKAVQDHIDAQNKLDTEAKRIVDEDRELDRATTDDAIRKRVEDLGR